MSIQLELPNSQIHIVDLQPGDIRTDFNDAVTKSKEHDLALPSQCRENLGPPAERNMKNAPKPDLVAQRVCELIDQPNPPLRVTVGDAFQTKIAPLIFRFLPQRLRIWGLKKYYGI